MIAEEKEELAPQLRFPTGFHFLPTDEELLDVYLRGKIDGREPPLDVFMDVNILDWDPAELVENRKAHGEGRYFFFMKRTASSSNKDGEPRRKLYKVKGSWKATGSLVEIRSSETGKVIGTKRILAYESKGAPDKWSMNEFVLDGRAGMGQWVLCTIQEKLNWKARNSKPRADKTAAAGTSRKGKRAAAGTRTERKSKRQKKEKTKAPSEETQQELQQKQQQQQQETTPDVSSEPPPLLTSDHQALHEEETMALLDGTTPMTQVVVGQEYPYGYEHYYLDAPAPQEAAYQGPGEPPLMTQDQQEGYLQLNWLQEQQQQPLEFEGVSLDPLHVHHQFDAAHEQHMLETLESVFFQVHPDQEPMPGLWQQQPGYTDDYDLFFPPAIGMEMEHGGGYHLPQEQALHPDQLGLGAPGFDGDDFVPTSQQELQFQQDPAKPSEQQQQASPDSVLSACQHGQEWWCGTQHGGDELRCSLCCAGGSN